MARLRSIKPGFYKNEDLAECSIWARFIFPGLWMMADREGRLQDRPKRIKAELLPFDDVAAESLLQELEQHKFIQRYVVAGNSYIQICNFAAHQFPHHRESASTIPAPESTDKARPSPRLDPDKARPSPRLDPDKARPSPSVSLLIRKRLINNLSEPTTTEHLSAVDKIAAASSSSIFKNQILENLKAWESERGKVFRCKPGDESIVAAWESRGLTLAHVEAAYSDAVAQREHDRQATAVNVRFLNAFLPDAPQPAKQKANGAAKAALWHESKTGVDAMAQKLDMPSYSVERYGAWPHFRAAVMNRAAEMEKTEV